MAVQFERTQVIEGLRNQIAQGTPVIGAGAGTGISAKFAEKGGADLIIIYNSGRFRMAGHPSWTGLLPIGDANGIVMQMGEREVLPAVQSAPVIAGVFASDPTRVMDWFLRQVKELGFSGVINFPSVGLYEGYLRSAMEDYGLGFQREVEMIGLARELGLFTMAYVFDVEQVTAMARAGLDCAVAHMGTTTGGTTGSISAMGMDQARKEVRGILEAGRAVNPTIITLCHGGPIAAPEDFSAILEGTGVEGFVGASSMERLPVEQPLEAVVRQFKRLGLRPNTGA